jgi:hypothetical protein
MNARWTISLTAAMAVLLGGALLVAAAEPNIAPNQSAMQGPAGIIRISTLLNTTVVDPQGQKLGQIKDVVLDPQTGQATFVVLDAEVPGSSHAMLAVPYRALWVSVNPVDKRQSVVLNLRPDQLRSAPQIQDDQWQMLQNPQFLEQVRDFYHLKTFSTAGPNMTQPVAPSVGSPNMTYSAARPIENPNMPAPSLQSPPVEYTLPPPCAGTGDSGWTQELEDFYNE